MISELEKRISKSEEKKIMKRIDRFSLKEKSAYEIGYSDGITYSNKLTLEIYGKKRNE